MIPYDIEYYKPFTIDEAVQLFTQLQNEAKRSIYYGVGTEWISMARLGQFEVDAVIDIKGIPDCRVLDNKDGRVTIGSAVTINQLITSGHFPLLCQHVRGIADHTSRNRITIGGNISSNLMYRECVFPLLLCDSQIVILRNGKRETHPIRNVFQQRLQLNPGEFIVQIITSAAETGLPFVSLKKTRFSKIDYPLVFLAAVKKNNRINIALSGVCAYPFRSIEMEDILNDTSLPLEQRIEQSLGQLPGPIVNDMQGSSAYRTFLLKNSLTEVIQTLEGA